MTVVDSDAHVVETERTWDFMDPSDAKYRPEVVRGRDGMDYWVIEGVERGFARGPVAAKGLSDKVSRRMVVDDSKRLMEDVPGRVAHMDELSIDVQVLYPTMYIGRMCTQPDTEVALSPRLQTAGSPTSGARQTAGYAGPACCRCTRWRRRSPSCASPSRTGPVA